MKKSVSAVLLVVFLVSLIPMGPVAAQPIESMAVQPETRTIDKSYYDWSFKKDLSPWSDESLQTWWDPDFFLKDRMHVNIVFVGIDETRIDIELFESQLPRTYKPINRYPTFYDPANPEYLGIKFRFMYHFRFASEGFAEDLFSFINSIGVIDGPTVYQEAYNAQPGALLTITENLWVPADLVEMWLEENVWRIGWLRKGYTIFFLDGYTNGYLTFHTYFYDEPDYDTGHSFGLRDSRQSIAFGGKHSRIWFYDPSAGPEFNSDNWYPELYWNPDLQAKPPIWHYGGLADPVAKLSIDFAEVTRFIAIDLLFTPSTLYRPLLAPKIHINIVMFENASDVGFSGADWIDPEIVEQVYEEYEPHKEWEVTFSDRNLMDYPLLNDIFVNFAQDGPSLYFPATMPAMFDFYFYYFFDHGLDDFLDDDASDWADYSIPVFAYAVRDDQMGFYWGLLGYADDDWATGTQTFINVFGTPDYIGMGYGFTNTIIHEVGHHVGLSHPHDGYDSELDLDYGPVGYFYFVWTGDESYTTMNYMGNVGHFGEFNKDTLYRHEGAMYMKAVKEMMEGFYPISSMDAWKLQRVYLFLFRAEVRFKRMRYYGMVRAALKAYKLMLELVDD